MPYPKDDAEEILQRHSVLDPHELSCEKINEQFSLEELYDCDFKLCVRNVGQANWNELLANNTVKFVYDIGAELHSKIDDVKTLFYERVEDYKRDKPILVLSHWDIDHYQCLLCANVQIIKECFSKFLCINMMKSVTSHKVYDDITKALGYNNVFCLNPANRTNGIKMHLWNRIGNIAFYKGEKSRNINYAGLCMFVSGNIKSANFTGDIKLIQAKYVYDQEKEFNSNTTDGHILVAPNHGGDYGKKARSYSQPTTDVVISVGAGNRYGHPEKYMLSYLKELSNDNISRTDKDGSIEKSI